MDSSSAPPGAVAMVAGRELNGQMMEQFCGDVVPTLDIPTSRTSTQAGDSQQAVKDSGIAIAAKLRDGVYPVAIHYSQKRAGQGPLPSGFETVADARSNQFKQLQCLSFSACERL
jgi:hypothetical protein